MNVQPPLHTPVRVPELGPSLGALVSARPVSSCGLDQLRIRMVSRLFEALGAARRAASQGDRTLALASLRSEAWLAIWEDAASQAAAQVIGRVRLELEAAAAESRLPARRLARVLPGAQDERAVAARIGSSGAPLVSALVELDEASDHLAAVSGLDRAALDRWQQELLRAGRRLEEAWSRLEAAARSELDDWRVLVARVRAWRRPVWPILTFFVLGEAAAVWLGLVFAGYLASPDWLAALWSRIAG